MSKFVVDPEHLDALAKNLWGFKQKAALMGELPIGDYGPWTGGPVLGELMRDFGKTLENQFDVIGDIIGYRAGELEAGADEYRRTEDSVRRGAGGGH